MTYTWKAALEPTRAKEVIPKPTLHFKVQTTKKTTCIGQECYTSDISSTNSANEPYYASDDSDNFTTIYISKSNLLASVLRQLHGEQGLFSQKLQDHISPQHAPAEIQKDIKQPGKRKKIHGITTLSSARSLCREIEQIYIHTAIKPTTYIIRCFYVSYSI